MSVAQMLAMTSSMELVEWAVFLDLDDERADARMSLAVNRGFNGGGEPA